MVDLYEALDAIFTRLKAGEDFEEILRDYPAEDINKLRRLVAVAREVQKGHNTRPSSAFRERTRPRLISEITSRRPPPLTFWQKVRLWWANLWRR
ncbi:MAG: hypothetical protein EPO32_04970 [Anaerolineae bacterium]|nr:MAG: hypothetical protein EPO32_04970 [Anaerolineae bacterium]